MKLTTVISRIALSGGRNGRWGITLLIALLMMAAQTAWAASTRQFPTTSGGSGTSGDPYKITSIADLNKLA